MDTQTWDEAEREMVMVYPKIDRTYEIDLNSSIQVEKAEGRNYIRLTDSTILCLWNQQKMAVSKLITSKHKELGKIQIQFRRELTTNRLYPVQVSEL